MAVPIACALFLGLPALPETASGSGRNRERIPAVIKDRLATLETKGRARIGRDTLSFREDLSAFYRKRKFRPAWILQGRFARPEAWELADAVNKCDREGLDPADYRIASLDSLLPVFGRRFYWGAGPSPELAAVLDMLLTDAYLRLGAHLLAGRVHPLSLADQWHISEEETDLAAYLEHALAERDEVRESLRRLAPSHPEYGILKWWLTEHRKIQSRGGWPAVPKGGILALGDTGSRVTSLCRRLALSGDLEAWDPEACGRSFDSSLVAAVKRFQGRHGLAATGRVDEATLRDLNVTVEDRIDQIRLGLECWRWLPRDLGERHARVNIADFSLTAWKGDKVELAMRVVVGRKEDSTPVFSDRIVSVSLNPSWNIPESIAKEEILPELKADPTYLERQGMELLTSWSERGEALRPDTIDWSEVTPETFRFRIRQKHGEGSALGKVKFVMTNPFNIYLHDTPSKAYFAGHRRALSHGCVRVERPVELAEWILAPDWNRESLLKEIAKGEPTILPAPGKGMPVHILYWTAFTDAEGGIQFRRDIYGWGRRMERDLQRTARR